MNNTLEELKKLPKEVREECAHKVGGGFGSVEVTVEYENGKYEVCSFTCLRKNYAPDHKVWFFDKKTIEQDEELKPILEAEDAEYERWSKNEGKDFDWEAFAQ